MVTEVFLLVLLIGLGKLEHCRAPCCSCQSFREPDALAGPSESYPSSVRLAGVHVSDPGVPRGPGLEKDEVGRSRLQEIATRSPVIAVCGQD